MDLSHFVSVLFLKSRLISLPFNSRHQLLRRSIEAMARDEILNCSKNGTFHKRCILPSEFSGGIFFVLHFFLFLFSIPNLIKTFLKTEMQARCSSRFQVK